MAVSRTLTVTPTFPVGNTVYAYVGTLPDSSLSGPFPGSPVGSTTVSTTGTVTFTGLNPASSYVLQSVVSGTYRFIEFRTDTAPGGLTIDETGLLSDQSDSVVLASHTVLNAIREGVPADAGIGSSGVFGTDATAALNALCQKAFLTGAAVYVPGAGRSYRIDGVVTIPAGVSVFTDRAGNPGGYIGPTNDWYDDVTGQFVVPPAAQATFLMTTTNSQIYLSQAGAMLDGFAFLWPNQIKPPVFSAGEVPVVYPYGIYVASGNNCVVRNITDYNSYKLLYSESNAGSRFEHFRSSSLNQILVLTANEFTLEDVWYNQGTNFAMGGAAAFPAGPLVHINNSGPFVMRGYQINGAPTVPTVALKCQSTWGGEISDCWFDQCKPIVITDPDGTVGGNHTTMYGFSNIQCGKGTVAPDIDINVQGGWHGSGSNIAAIQITNSIVSGGVKVAGSVAIDLDNVLTTDAPILDMTPGTDSGQLIWAKVNGCGCPPPTRFRHRGTGTSYVYCGGNRAGQTGLYGDQIDGGALHVYDRDRIYNQAFTLPVGSYTAGSTTTIGTLLVPQQGGSLGIYFAVLRAWGYADSGDKFVITVNGTDYDLFTVGFVTGDANFGQAVEGANPSISHPTDSPTDPLVSYRPTPQTFAKPFGCPVKFVRSGTAGTLTVTAGQAYGVNLRYVVTPD